MGLRSRFFAYTYDRFSGGSEEAGLAEMRRKLIAGASGPVMVGVARGMAFDPFTAEGAW